ncbi:MAG: nucleoside kinase [Eubacteriales bacterium]|nr:nucleoside kinase [Eubacteriales bacterium]MDD4324488.1 nucleoside kinase [Eubacteriales bacterium]MDD4541701.1 nucleoside kinase [Eubacteriales bacterium]
MATISELIILTVDDLEDQLGSSKYPNFVAASEKMFSDQVNAFAERVLADDKIRAIFVSGPTSSGKTTSSRLLSQILTANGRNTIPIELDDFYREEDLRYDDEGRPDYESIDTLDLELLGASLEHLFRVGEVAIPTFEFARRRRFYEDHKKIKLNQGDIVIIEGLHGLNETVTSHVAKEARLSYFIMPHGRVLADARMISNSDIRMLRRISRDVNKRGSSAMDTIDYWPMIDRAEKDFIPAYLAAADYYINSLLPYEFTVIAPLARNKINESLERFFDGTLGTSTYTRNSDGFSNLRRAVQEASRLVWICEQLPAVSPTVVPAGSLLQEFI